MQYISTRGNYPPISALQAIVQGMVPRGGLFVPEAISHIDLTGLENLTYQELAFEVLKPFLCSPGNYSEAELKEYIQLAYNREKFDAETVTPLAFLEENLSILELWHGPTAAFKDVALQLMPYLLTGASKKLGKRNEIVILVATSGDTGKAALEGFKNVPGIRIIVFYPDKGVSRIQELQMVTTDGKNTYVTGVKGNFDDCQNMVKEIFGNSSINALLNQKGFELSSANSINWGRLVPQIVYYFWGYLEMVRKRIILSGDPVNVCVPTGNFGNILAGYYAKVMGLPINKLICASNKNRVLADFINTGIYDRRREFYRTSSPSMDILISSNLERFLYEITSHNAIKINRWYKELSRKGYFKVDDSTRQVLKNILYGGFADEEETLKEIKFVFEKYHYLIDPHTAVGMKVYRDYQRESGSNLPAFICSTASPFKFNLAVYRALTGDDSVDDEFKVLEKLKEISKQKIHRSLEGLDKLSINHNRTISVKEGFKEIKRILGI